MRAFVWNSGKQSACTPFESRADLYSCRRTVIADRRYTMFAGKLSTELLVITLRYAWHMRSWHAVVGILAMLRTG
jgi:hypothetical protein